MTNGYLLSTFRLIFRLTVDLTRFQSEDMIKDRLEIYLIINLTLSKLAAMKNQ